ncbi:unnamed protein product [Cylicocyclus nassatus]|uniref:Uncharacterized protein n=1 Tax=Cylicocyclus nassatus TaxID=53992 RepID=A0AA36GWA8_CYLNA|nr:unnamed protein product [Cylicocyclus nassatus]
MSMLPVNTLFFQMKATGIIWNIMLALMTVFIFTEALQLKPLFPLGSPGQKRTTRSPADIIGEALKRYYYLLDRGLLKQAEPRKK